MGRVTTQTTKNGSTVILTESYTYKSPTSTTTSAQIATYTTAVPNGYSVTYSYTYDANGNITSISDGTNTTGYVYDSANQLIRENNQAGGFAYKWTYDDAGNILLREEYAYTTGTLGTPTKTVNYTYGNSDWGDLLTQSGYNSYTYDTVGNMLSDGTWSYTWKHGRQLTSMANSSGTTWTYTYDANGMRTARNGSNGVSYTYVYNGGQLMQMTRGTTVYQFTYDANGTPMTVSENGTVYYYVTNLQGDVMAILNSSGTEVVRYSYNAWGKKRNISGTMASTLGTYNPLRYRGYVYDQETDLYYVSSRYYSPQLGRWINADSVIADVGGAIQGYNMFAYCFNNPVNLSDPTGNWPACVRVTDVSVNKVEENPVKRFVNAIVEDYHNYNPNNQSEETVFQSNYFSNYKGTLVVKTPFDASFSFGIIGLSTRQQDVDTLRHEYGHTVQLENMGVKDYIPNVFIPSVTINLLRRNDKLPYSYYGAPWEAEADMLGGVDRTYDNTPWPEGTYNSYLDLIKLFW